MCLTIQMNNKKRFKVETEKQLTGALALFKEFTRKQ